MGQGNVVLNRGPGTQVEEERVFDGVRTATHVMQQMRVAVQASAY